jgi:hypothetical protein
LFYAVPSLVTEGGDGAADAGYRARRALDGYVEIPRQHRASVLRKRPTCAESWRRSTTCHRPIRRSISSSGRIAKLGAHVPLADYKPDRRGARS